MHKLIALLGSVFLLTTTSFAAESAEQGFSFTLLKNGITAPISLQDGSIYTEEAFAEGDTLTLSATEEISTLVLRWSRPPADFRVESTADVWQNTDDFLHQAIPVSGREITLSQLAGHRLAEISAYGAGELPAAVQQWQPPSEDCDILIFPTHSDDDTLYFGALIAEYAAKGKTIQLAYLVNHWDTIDRPHELLDGMWEMGLRHYPILPPFPDYPSRALEHARGLYDETALLGYQVETIRRTKPEIVVGHDVDGEYGHGVHMLNTFLLQQAVTLSGDPAAFSESAAKFGIHLPLKTYLHLYPEHSILLDVHAPLDNRGGETPFAIATRAFGHHHSQHKWDLAVYDGGVDDCRAFGLFLSQVGYADSGNDLFAGIPMPEPVSQDAENSTSASVSPAESEETPPISPSTSPEEISTKQLPWSLILAAALLGIVCLLLLLFKNRKRKKR